jgi:hypothetical protein
MRIDALATRSSVKNDARYVVFERSVHVLDTAERRTTLSSGAALFLARKRYQFKARAGENFVR